MWSTGQLHCLVGFGPNGHASLRIMIHQRMLILLILIIVGDGQTILEFRHVVGTVLRIADGTHFDARSPKLRVTAGVSSPDDDVIILKQMSPPAGGPC
eukprot:scaffold216842_cov40-Attheya_sp.AAC.2